MNNTLEYAGARVREARHDWLWWAAMGCGTGAILLWLGDMVVYGWASWEKWIGAGTLFVSAGIGLLGAAVVALVLWGVAERRGRVEFRGWKLAAAVAFLLGCSLLGPLCDGAGWRAFEARHSGL